MLCLRHLAAALLVPVLVGAPAPRRGDTLSPEELEHLVGTLCDTIESRYVFPEVAKEISAHLKERLYAGAYEDVDLVGLAGRLTTDLRAVNDDRHLSVFVPPRPAAGTAPTPEERQRAEREQARRTNHGFRRLEVLDGNVGYLQLDGFAEAAVAGETAVAAMAFFANVDALVIDLRANGGGDPTMIQLLCSYFFAEPTLLNTFEFRGKETLDQFWTLPHVPGRRLGDVPLFVLTSRSTFSAAEEFTYDLKVLGRARIVGETTGGGAHPGSTHELDGRLAVFVPDGRAINPTTGTNWEGKGVEPDLKVPAARALDEALLEARAAAMKRAR